jgi:hypothetical protein
MKDLFKRSLMLSFHGLIVPQNGTNNRILHITSELNGAVYGVRFNELLAFIVFTTLEVGFAQQALTPHDVQNNYFLALMPVQDTARRLNNLTVARFFKLGRGGTQAWMLIKLVNVRKNTPNKLSCSGLIFDCDVVGEGFEIR